METARKLSGSCGCRALLFFRVACTTLVMQHDSDEVGFPASCAREPPVNCPGTAFAHGTRPGSTGAVCTAR